MAEWQPIESAPRDGTRVLAFPIRWDRTSAAVMYFKKPFGFVSAPGDWAAHPTHWQPLPEPPTTKGEKA